jgi:hypothetical protein
MITLSIPEPAYRDIEKHLQKRTEQVVFLFLSQTQSGGDQLFEVMDYYLVPAHELVYESQYHAEVSDEAQRKVIKMAWDKGLALGEIHSHPQDLKDVSFSPSDTKGFKDFVPHVWWRLKKKPYVALVFGKTDFDALAWISDAHAAAGVDRVLVGRKELAPTGITIGEIREAAERERERYSRQTSIFGEEGQRKIAKTRIAIVGLGGLGSHVAQQLAYLGVKQFALVDGDKVDRSNLNRLVGASEYDLGREKVAVLGELIERIQPGAEVHRIPKTLLSREAFNAIRGADFVFGCVDNDGVRLVLLELCCAFRKPYVDLATEIPDAGSFGGRMIFTGINRGCPMCHGELDQGEIQDFFATPEQRSEQERIYGVERAALGGSGPSVVSLNGMLASVGVIEFMRFVSGLRPNRGFLTYRGNFGTINIPSSAPKPGCYFCGAIWRGTEQVDVERYLEGTNVE